MNDASSVKKIDLNKTDWRGSREFFESLVDELRSLDDKEEKYDFTWVGKRKAIIEAGAPINKILRPDVKNSKNWDTTENLFIEGDNLDALKLLQESYLGKVKMIYIDPPYNTGKDFVYHDNFKVSTEEYDESTEYKDEDGNIQFKKNEKSNGRYHSDWLSMMYPRLKLARNLLSDDGVIFISIDDNEQANLKKLCDEIFGEDNFINSIVVRRQDKNLNLQFIELGLRSLNIGFEFVYIYSKSTKATIQPVKVSVKDETRSTQGYWKGFWNGPDRPTMRYDILGFTPQEGQWKWKKNKALEAVNNYIKYESQFAHKMSLEEYWELTDKKLSFIRRQKSSKGKHGGVDQWIPPSGEKLRTTNWTDILAMYKPIWLNLPFESPKNPDLLIELIKCGANKDAIIVDFFSGSASTAHSVMQLNAVDGGSRKWILVQLPEETPVDSEARKAGYKTIPEIARERIRRAGDHIAKEHPDAKVDYGFRSLVIADTNYKEVYKPVSQISQASLLDTVDNIKEDRGDLDLLYGVLTQLALELNRPIETRDISGSTVFLYDYLGEVSGLVACFSTSVSDEVIKHIAGLKPLIAVFRDSSFVDSQAKVNLSEHFRVISPDTKVRVI